MYVEPFNFSCSENREMSKWGLLIGYTIKVYPSDLLSPARFNLLKVPQSSQTESTTEDQVFRHMSQWRTFHMKTITARTVVKFFLDITLFQSAKHMKLINHVLL